MCYVFFPHQDRVDIQSEQKLPEANIAQNFTKSTISFGDYPFTPRLVHGMEPNNNNATTRNNTQNFPPSCERFGNFFCNTHQCSMMGSALPKHPPHRIHTFPAWLDGEEYTLHEGCSSPQQIALA